MLEPFGTDLWVVHAPLRLLGVPAGRWMAVVRLPGGALLVHSPAPLDDDLRRALKGLGEVRWGVAASRLHGHVWMEQYRAPFPPARGDGAVPPPLPAPPAFGAAGAAKAAQGPALRRRAAGRPVGRRARPG